MKQSLLHWLKNLLTRIRQHGFVHAHYLFLAIALLAGLAFMHFIPPLGGNDESAHFARAYQLSGGHIKATKLVDGTWGGQVPASFDSLFRYADTDNRNNVNIFSPGGSLLDRHRIDNPAGYRVYERQAVSKQLVNFSFPASANYSPVAYVGPLAGVIVGRVLRLDLGHLLQLSRFGNLLLYCAVCFLTLFLVRGLKARWLIFVVALLPNAVIGASVISADALAMSLVLLLFAVSLRLRQSDVRLTRPMQILLAVIVIALPLTKPAYAPVILLLLILPGRLWSSKSAEWLYKSVIVGASVVLLALWTYATRDVASNVAVMLGPATASQVNSHGQVTYMLHHVLHLPALFQNTWYANDAFLTVGLIGSLGWNAALIPTWLAIISYSSLLVAALYQNGSKLLQTGWIVRGAYGLLGVGLGLLVFVVFYLQYTPVGAPAVIGVQGRYFIPLIPLIAYGIIGLLPVSVRMLKRTSEILFASTSSFVLLISLLVYHAVFY